MTREQENGRRAPICPRESPIDAYIKLPGLSTFLKDARPPLREGPPALNIDADETQK